MKMKMRSPSLLSFVLTVVTILIAHTDNVVVVASQDSESVVAHFVPHSHCDAAYKKTFAEYYETEVRHVLNSILEALGNDVSRRFTWAETSYLTSWWKDDRTTQSMKKSFHDYLVLGRLEIVNGGWVMHDEAITRYDSQIQQMTLGHDNLLQMFQDNLHRPNASVETGWQIDPFGAASFTANLHKWAGMSFLVTNRIPAPIKEKFKAEQLLQFVWETPQNATVLVNVMDTHYESPRGYDWESLEHPSVPVSDDIIGDMADELVQVLQTRRGYYRTPHILVPIGGDFRFQNATLQFQNLDRIIEYIRSNTTRYHGITIRYSTPRQYRKALLNFASSRNMTLPTMRNTTFINLWAGFYFQTPILKQYVRTCELLLRTCEVHLFQAMRENDHVAWEKLREWAKTIKAARETVALMQHHDAITATSYRFVTADYMLHLLSTFRSLSTILSKLVNVRAMKTEADVGPSGVVVGGGPSIHESLLIRESQHARSISLDKVLSPQMGAEGITLTVLNSLSQGTHTVVHFVCTRPDIAIVAEHSNESIVSQATPLEHHLEVANLGLFQISFKASVPALGQMQYRLVVCDTTCSTDQHPPKTVPSLLCAQVAEELTVEDVVSNGLVSPTIRIDLDERTHDLSRFTRIYGDGTTSQIDLEHNILLYYGGDDSIYSLNTNVESSNPPPLFGKRRRRFVSAYKGPFYSQISIAFTEWLEVRYRVMNTTDTADASLLQVTMVAGPLPPNVNVASRFKTNMSNTLWFYDENGFQPTLAWYNTSNGVGDRNSRPIVSRTWLQQRNNNNNSNSSCNDETEDDKQFSIYTVDPRGAVSKKNGEIDIFMHRRNNKTHAWWDSSDTDWWKAGDDISVYSSSIWLELSGRRRRRHPETACPRRTATQLHNDALVFAQDGYIQHHGHNVSVLQDMPQSLHIVSLRLSQADQEINSNRQEAWIDLQVENFSTEESEVFDIATIFVGSDRISLDAISLNSLTYLKKIDSRSGVRGEGGVGNGECGLKGTDGGKQWLLSVGPRRICSVRIPVIPLKKRQQQQQKRQRMMSFTGSGIRGIL